MAQSRIKRFVLKRILSWTKARVRDRENLRFERTRIFGQARRVFFAIGRQLHAHDRLDAPRDVFFLTVQEILGAIEGFGLDRDLKAMIAQRKRQWSSDLSSPYPGDRVVMMGAIITSVVTAAALPAASAVGGQDLQGTGCLAGMRLVSMGCTRSK